jgi:cell division protein FtsW
VDEGRRTKGNMRLALGTIVLVAGMLVSLGLATLNSIGMDDPRAMRFFHQQWVWLGLGLVACAVVAVPDYRRVRWVVPVVWLTAVVLLVLARTPGVGRMVNGAWRWISLGPLTLQPSELAKVALVLSVALYAQVFRRRMGTLGWGLVVPGLGIGLVLALVLVGKDLGTTALLAAWSAAMLYAAGTRLRYLLPTALVAVVGLSAYLATDSVRWKRVEAYLHPERHLQGMALQSEQSKVAIGSGGWEGRGLGSGAHKSGYVPEQTTDFIFSVIGEELGLRVTMPVLLAYMALVLAAMHVARRAPDVYGSMVALGVGLLVGMQAAMNIAVTTGSIPNKGLALPLVSYGGSCLISMLILVGLLINVAWRSAREDRPQDLPEGVDREAVSLQAT